MMSDGEPMDPSGNHANPDVEEPEVLTKDDTQEVEEGRPESDLGNSDYISLSSSENQTHSRMTSPADSDSEFIDAQENVEKEKCIDIIVKKSPNSETFMKDVIEECLDLMDTFMKIKESKEVSQKEQFRGTSQKENEKIIENKQCEDTKQTYKEMPSGSTDKKVENEEPEENFQLDMEKDGYQLGGTLSMTTVVDENGFTIGSEDLTAKEDLTVKEDEVKLNENNINIKEIVSKLEMPQELEKNITLEIDANEVAESITKIFMNLEPKSVSKSNIFERSEKLLSTLSTLQIPKLNNFIKIEENRNLPDLESDKTDMEINENEKPPEIDASDFETQDFPSRTPSEQKVSVKDQIKIYESQEKLTGKDSIQKTPSKTGQKEQENLQDNMKINDLNKETLQEPKDFQELNISKTEIAQENFTEIKEKEVLMDEISPEKDLTEETKTPEEPENQTEDLQHFDELKPQENPHVFEEPKIESEDDEKETQPKIEETEKSPEEFNEEETKLENSPEQIDEKIDSNEIEEEKEKESSPKLDLNPEEDSITKDPTEIDSFDPKEQIKQTKSAEQHDFPEFKPKNELPDENHIDSLDLKEQLENEPIEKIEETKSETAIGEKQDENPSENIENEEKMEDSTKATFNEFNHEETTTINDNTGLNSNENDEKLENSTERKELKPEETSSSEKPSEVETLEEEKNSKIPQIELEPKEELPISENMTEIVSHDLKEKDQNQNNTENEEINIENKPEEKPFKQPTEVDSHNPREKNEIETSEKLEETENKTENIEEKIYEKSFNDGYLEYKNKILNEDLNIIPGKLELLQKELTDKTTRFENSVYGETFENYNKEIDKLYFLRKKESMQLIEYSPEPLLLKLPQNIFVEIEEEGEKIQIESDSKTCVLDLNLSMKQQINELIENLDESPSEVNEMEKAFSEIDTVETIHKDTKYTEEPHSSEMKSSSSAYLITYISEPESLQGSASNTEKKELEGLDDSILKEVAKEEIIKRLDETFDEDLEVEEGNEKSKMIEFEAEVKIENDKNLSRSLTPQVEQTEDEKSHTALGTPLSTNYSKNMARSITVSRRAKSPNEKPNQQLRNSKINLPVKNTSGFRRLSPSKPQSPRESENPEQLKASSKTEENKNCGTVENETSDLSSFAKKSTSPTMKTSGLMTRFNLQLERYHKEVFEFEKLKTNIKNIIKNLTTVHGELATNGTEELPQLPQDIFENSNDNQESLKQEEENKKLKESIKKKTGEIDQLKKQLFSFKEDMKQLEEKINMNEMRKREERDNNSRLMSQYSNLKEQLERMSKEKSDLEQKKNKELDQLRTRLKGEAKKREQVEKSVDENLHQIEKLKSEKEELKTQYFDLHQTISEKTQKVEKYKNEVKNKKNELEGINKEVNELKGTLEKQNELITVLKIDLDKAKNDLSTSSKRELELSGILNEKDKVYDEILQNEKSIREELVDFICDLSSLSEYKISPDSRNLLYSGSDTNEILNEIKNEMEKYIEEKNQNLLKRDKTINSLKMDLKERQNLLEVFQSSELDKSEPEVKEPLKTDADVRSMTAKELIELMENKKQAIERMENELQSLHNIHSYCGMRRSFLETKINDLEHLLRDYQY